VLCPGWIKTRIFESERNYPGQGPVPEVDAQPVGAMLKGMIESGMEPSALAERVVDAIVNERFIILSDDSHFVLAEVRTQEAKTGAQPSMPQF
jgi:hypothetical protein